MGTRKLSQGWWRTGHRLQRQPGPVSGLGCVTRRVTSLLGFLCPCPHQEWTTQSTPGVTGSGGHTAAPHHPARPQQVPPRRAPQPPARPGPSVSSAPSLGPYFDLGFRGACAGPGRPPAAFPAPSGPRAPVPAPRDGQPQGPWSPAPGLAFLPGCRLCSSSWGRGSGLSWRTRSQPRPREEPALPRPAPPPPPTCWAWSWHCPCSLALHALQLLLHGPAEPRPRPGCPAALALLIQAVQLLQQGSLFGLQGLSRGVGERQAVRDTGGTVPKPTPPCAASRLCTCAVQRRRGGPKRAESQPWARLRAPRLADPAPLKAVG